MRLVNQKLSRVDVTHVYRCKRCDSAFGSPEKKDEHEEVCVGEDMATRMERLSRKSQPQYGLARGVPLYEQSAFRHRWFDTEGRLLSIFDAGPDYPLCRVCKKIARPEHLDSATHMRKVAALDESIAPQAWGLPALPTAVRSVGHLLDRWGKISSCYDWCCIAKCWICKLCGVAASVGHVYSIDHGNRDQSQYLRFPVVLPGICLPLRIPLPSTSTDVHSAVPSLPLSSALDVSGKDSRAKRKQHRQLCSICQHKEVVCAVQPCYHRCACESCAAGISTSCPICRGCIDSWVRIFDCGCESDSD